MGDVRLVVVSAVACAVLLLTGCTDAAPKRHTGAPLPGPSTGTPRVVHGRAAVVWISGQLEAVGPRTVILVEPAGARVALRRLAEGATRFFRRSEGSWASLGADAVSGIGAGTPVCTEALRDRGIFLAIRVFVGAVCGPRT
jgi:hypothetical protein